MITFTYYSVVSGTYKTLTLGCDGTTNSGGDYQRRDEHTRSTIQKYLTSSSLTSSCYKIVSYTFYDCTTKFLTDTEASSFATEFLSSKDIKVTCAEDGYTNAPAILETSSAPIQTNRQNGVNYYSFTVKIATPVTQY